MKGKLLTFLVLPSLLFSASLIFLAAKVSAKTVNTTCVATTCGTTTGTKDVPMYTEVCDKGCPTVKFTWTKRVYSACPVGYSVYHTAKCKKDSNPNKGLILNREYVDVEHNVSVTYEKSSDPNKCHRPSDSTLESLMPHDIVQDFKHDNSEWKTAEDVNCHDEITSYDNVACYDATVIPCEGTCPTYCGYEGGTVPDGDGGTKTCTATDACPVEEECPTYCGYEGGEVSDGEGGTKTCEATVACEAAQECPTTCGYEGGTVPDGEGGTKTCEATAECPVEEVCEYDSTLLADDPLCAPIDDEGEVKGVTDVVTADTAGGISTSAYILQDVLVFITAGLFVATGKEFLKKR